LVRILLRMQLDRPALSSTRQAKTRAVVANGSPASFPDGRLAWPVSQLCKSVGLSRSQFYGLVRAGHGPRRLPVGPALVTAGAAAEWLSRLEQLGDAVPAALKDLRENRAAHTTAPNPGSRRRRHSARRLDQARHATA